MGLFRFFFILQSYLLLIFIYLLNHSITIGAILRNLGIASAQVTLPDLPNWISYSEKELTELLNGMNERYYITEIDGEKRIANSVTVVGD